MFVNAIECKECDVIVYSRTSDDVRPCSCGRVVVMGGQEHFKYDIYTNPDYEIKKINVDASMIDLYNDWLWMEDKYGLVEHNHIKKQNQKVYIF